MIRKPISLLLFFSLFFCFSFVCSAELIKGDDKAMVGESFSFPIKEYVLHSSGRSFYVAAHPDDATGSKEFAVSKLDRRLDRFIPLAFKDFEIKKEDKGESDACDTECNVCKSEDTDTQENCEKKKSDGEGQRKRAKSKKITKSGTPAPTENPLYDKGVKFLGLLESGEQGEDYPIVVTKDENNVLHVIDQSFSRKRIPVISCDTIKDAKGQKIGKITSLAGGSDGNIFAAVTSEGQPFGEPSSGIAHLRLSFSKSNVPREDGSGEMKEKTEKSLNQVGNAMLLDKTSNVLKIDAGADLVAAEVTGMHWDSYLGCFYIALQVEAGYEGAKAIVVGKFKNVEATVGGAKRVVRLFELRSIADDAVFSGTDQIVAGAEPGAFVSLHKVRTMTSSNRLPYLIVLGKNGEPDKTKTSVFALPLVKNPSDEEYHGTLASKYAVPEDLFEGCYVKSLKYRYVKDRAKEPEDLFTEDCPEAMVGGGPLENDISDIFVYSDAVYAVASSDSDEDNGIFMSRALFDENGKIKRWTKWQKVANSVDEIFGGALDAVFGNFITLSGNPVATSVKTVKRTFWGDGDETGLANLAEILSQAFQKCEAGIQGLFEFPYQSVLKNIDLLVATGLRKIALVELGSNKSGDFERNTGDFSSGMKVYTGGAIGDSPGSDTRVIAISGRVLDQLGPIVASEISVVSAEKGRLIGRLFVGGVGGIAVLVDSNGNGWDENAGLGPNFQGLIAGMEFKKVGNFRFVRKIVAQGDWLFVLTDKALYRIDVSNSDFVAGVFDITQIAVPEGLPNLTKRGAFLDFVMSGRLGVLATSLGLYRVGDGKNITEGTDLDWTKVKVPAYFGPIKQLFPISSTLEPNSFAKDGVNGMLYVLGADPGKNKAQLNRFSINEAENTAVNDATILPLPDFFYGKPVSCEEPCEYEGSYSYFVHFGTYRKLYEEDGGLKFNGRDRDLQCYPFVELLPPGLMSASVFPIVASRLVPLGIENDCDVVRVLKSFTGPVFIAGSFGLKINE